MLFFPGSKINLGLRIGKLRADGYHPIQSVFVPLPLTDILEVKPGGADFSFMESGLGIPGTLADNLCYKAWKLFNEKYAVGGVSVHLHKMVPMGAGLGGGSADATAMIKALNWFFKLNIPVKELEELSAQLGSDCPFFVVNSTALVTGRGEELTTYPLDMKGLFFFLVFPDIHISTAEAFSELDKQDRSLSSGFQPDRGNIDAWKENLVNDFEALAFKKHSELKKIKESLYEAGAVYASMTGSGSAIYGIFRERTFPETSLTTFSGKF